MTAITLTNLGGVRPSVSPRALSDADAQKSNNLLARTGEFRPLQPDLQVFSGLGTSNPKTIYRLERTPDGLPNTSDTTGWLSLAVDGNVVRNPVDEDTTGRSFATYESGPPGAFGWANASDVALGIATAGTLVTRPIGSPAPTVAPTVVVADSGVFTTKDKAAAVPKIGAQVLRIVRAAMTNAWVGPSVVSGTGYVAAESPLTASSTQGYMSKLYRLAGNPATGAGTLSSAYNPGGSAPTSSFGFVFSPLLKPIFAQTAGETVNGTSLGTFWHAAISFRAYARSFTLDTTAAAAALRALDMPGGSPGQKFFSVSAIPADDVLTGTNGLLTKISNFLNAPMSSAKGKEVQNKFDALHHRLVFTYYEAGPQPDSDAIAGTITRAMGELGTAVESLEAYYVNLFGEVNSPGSEFAALVSLWYSESGLDTTVPAGISSVMETRFWCYTYVTNWGYESAPSPVSDLLDMESTDNATVTLTLPPITRYINTIRLYRSNSGSASAAFQFVKELTITLNATGTTSILDDVKSSELQEVLPSTTWLEPPSNLRGLVSMPNGILAGFFENTVCFCEPYYPYAWPFEYQITCQSPIVALGVFGSTLVVMTKSGVDYISGSDSASMSQNRDISKQSCTSMQSVASVEGGVVYSSPDGLCLATSQGVQLITQGHFTRDDWQGLQPATVRAGYHESTYYFMCGTLGSNYVGCLHLDTGKLTTIGDALNPFAASAFYQDPLTDRLYYANGTTVRALLAGTGAPRTALWRSKKFTLPKPTQLAWLDIDIEPARDVDGDIINPPAFPYLLTIRMIKDGVLVQTTQTFTAPIRLVPGLYKDVEIEIETQSRWTRLTVASTTQELQSIV